MSSKKAGPKAASGKWLTSLPGAKPGAAAGESDPRSSTDLGRPLCSHQGCAQETLPSESGFRGISELGSGTVDGGFGAQKSIPDPGPETRAPALGWGEGHRTRTHGDGTQAHGDRGQVLRQSSEFTLGILRLSVWSTLTLCSTWAIPLLFPACGCCLKPPSPQPLPGQMVTACPCFGPAVGQEGRLLSHLPPPVVPLFSGSHFFSVVALVSSLRHCQGPCSTQGSTGVCLEGAAPSPWRPGASQITRPAGGGDSSSMPSRG